MSSARIRSSNLFDEQITLDMVHMSTPQPSERCPQLEYFICKRSTATHLNGLYLEQSSKRIVRRRTKSGLVARLAGLSGGRHTVAERIEHETEAPLFRSRQ